MRWKRRCRIFVGTANLRQIRHNSSDTVAQDAEIGSDPVPCKVIG